MDNIDFIKEKIQASVDVKIKLLNNPHLIEAIKAVAEEMAKVFKNDGKVLFCGNGGSAADAQHISAELSGRFYKDREPLNSEALHVNTSYLTAVANDYSYDEVYSRMVKASGRKGDILVGISTSGNSPNILRALETANQRGLITVGLTGESGGKMKDVCHFLIPIPSRDTPRIQESHILVGHILCEMVERELFQ
jgi:D-sedoheptulose 7-phosphate isomerase